MTALFMSIQVPGICMESYKVHSFHAAISMAKILWSVENCENSHNILVVLAGYNTSSKFSVI